MRLWSLLNARNPLWKHLGWGILLGIAVISGVFVYLGPRSLEPKSSVDVFRGSEGKFGTITEQLGQGRLFTLDYDTVTGDQENLDLFGVRGRLEEPDVLWKMDSPSGHRSAGSWILQGPMHVVASASKDAPPQGEGNIPGPGPALAWERGVWRGLAPLKWQDLEGQGKGLWHMPAGWRRELDGRFIVDKGPVVWEALDPGAVRRLQAQRLWLTLGFREGHLEEVAADLEGGRIWAGSADLNTETLRWFAPLRFERSDGWVGQAEGGAAPRPQKGEPLQQVELREFQAQRPVNGGAERLKAGGARWSAAGLRLEREVKWEQPLDGEWLVLRAPRVLIREGLGPDLPAELPLGEAWAEGHPVLTWGLKSLSSPQMQVRRKDRTWRIVAPVLGRSEQGTFSSGRGQGSPRKWDFEGPIKASLFNGGSLRGDRLVWQSETWTVTGNLATWTRVRERLAGPRIIWKGGTITLPEGVSGSLASLDGDFQMRADRGEYQAGEVRLSGGVQCQGRGWRLQADQISVSLGAGNLVKKVTAKGAVTLRGRLGEGWGEFLELEPDPNAPKVRWQGRVRGLAEVKP